jgi:hypothetical protein
MPKTEALFVPHCDDPPCDLGVFEYTCPVCKHGGTDYDVWWSRDDILLHGAKPVFACEHCGEKLTVFWDDIEHGMFVTS